MLVNNRMMPAMTVVVATATARKATMVLTTMAKVRAVTIILLLDGSFFAVLVTTTAVLPAPSSHCHCHRVSRCYALFLFDMLCRDDTQWHAVFFQSILPSCIGVRN